MNHSLKHHAGRYFSLAARQSGVVLIGDVAAKGVTFAFALIVMALVSPEEYIAFGLFLTVLALVSQFTDFGVNPAFVRFYALYKEPNPARASAHLHLALRVKVLALAITSAAVIAFAPGMASLLQHPELTSAFRLLGFGLLAIGIFEFILSVYQAKQAFRSLTALRISEAVLKISFIGWFVAASTFTLERAYQAYVFAPAIVVALVLLTPLLRNRATYAIRDVGSELYGFGKWLAVSTIATMFMQHLDVLMIAPMLEHTPEQAGIYYAGKKFCTPFQVLTTSLITVFYPKAMALQTVAQMRKYAVNTLRVSVPIGALLFLYIGALMYAIPAYFPQYSGSVPVVAVLFIGWLWTLLGNPLTILMLSIHRAHIAARISFVQLGVMVASHYFFIAHLGAIGAAISNVLVWFLGGIISLWYIYHHRHEIETVKQSDS